MKKIFAILFIVSLAVVSCRYANDASNTMYNEVKVSSLLKKYTMFKDMSAALDAKIASIQVYEKRFESLKKDYGTSKRSEWSREDREQANLWESEVSGIKASYNELAARYNADMAKINYRFCNVGDLPQGATDPLPRNYKPYLTE